MHLQFVGKLLCLLLLFHAASCLLVDDELALAFFLVEHGSVANVNGEAFVALEGDRFEQSMSLIVPLAF